MYVYVEQVVDLLDPTSNALLNMSVEEARQRVLTGDSASVRAIEGSFALVARNGKSVKLARSLDRPMRYFLAKREEGPALIIADRIDKIVTWLKQNGYADQFQPAYTRMVPAHYVVGLELLGCPDPNPSYVRYLNPLPNSLPADTRSIGHAYIGALANEVSKWLQSIPEREPIGVCFSGGIDSGAVFIIAYHVMQKLGMSPSRLKAFTLKVGEGPDAGQAFDFLKSLGLEMFLETIEAKPDDLEADEAILALEDYQALDIQCAVMGLALHRGIRQRYPDWVYLIDGDGGDENLKDYPIEENPELTIRSVVNNPLLYQEGWGVGTLKHSLTYSGGLSRSVVRTYAPGIRHGFKGFSPFMRPALVEIAAAIPFIELTQFEVARLYELKAEIVGQGVNSITNLTMPTFPKRRFQHGALSEGEMVARLPHSETDYRKRFAELYA